MRIVSSELRTDFVARKDRARLRFSCIASFALSDCCASTESDTGLVCSTLTTGVSVIGAGSGSLLRMARAMESISLLSLLCFIASFL